MTKSLSTAARSPAGKARPARSQRRLQTRRSGVHGKGVFALQDIAEGEQLIEYVGEVISWKEALRRHPHDPSNPQHTFYFHLDDKHVIDAKVGGNSSRWINHSCAPNCEADVDAGRVFVRSLRNVAAGEELFYDYGLVIDEPMSPKLLAEYPCWCGAPTCRGTLLAPKEEAPSKAKKKKKKNTKKKKEMKKAKQSARGKKDKKGEKKSLDKKAKK